MRVNERIREGEKIQHELMLQNFSYNYTLPKLINGRLLTFAPSNSNSKSMKMITDYEAVNNLQRQNETIIDQIPEVKSERQYLPSERSSEKKPPHLSEMKAKNFPHLNTH